MRRKKYFFIVIRNQLKIIDQRRESQSKSIKKIGNGSNITLSCGMTHKRAQQDSSIYSSNKKTFNKNNNNNNRSRPIALKKRMY